MQWPEIDAGVDDIMINTVDPALIDSDSPAEDDLHAEEVLIQQPETDPGVEDSGVSRTIDLSAVVVLNGSQIMYPVRALHDEYKDQFDKAGLNYEIVFVVDGDFPIPAEDVDYLKNAGNHASLLMFRQRFGYAASLSAGFDHASGPILLTLPSYHQVAPESLIDLVQALADNDMVVARRWPRIDSWLNRAQTTVFNAIIRSLGFNFKDLTCAVRVFKRQIIENVYIYGDQHRFFPVLASHQGFRVKEVDIPQSEKDALRSNFRPGVYVRRLLDLLSIFFLVKFTKKPLRFFGLPGLFIFGVGAVFTIILAIQRMYMGVPLADRPALLLGLLMVVLGMQFFAIGLIGELVIFIHARNMKSYRIDSVFRATDDKV